MRDLAFPSRSSFTSSALCLRASMVAVLGYEWCCSRMCVLEAQGSLRQATFLSEWGILYSYFSFAPLKISAGWWVVHEGLHWIKIGQQGSWEQLFVTTMCWKWPVAWTDYTQWSLSGQQTYARDLLGSIAKWVALEYFLSFLEMDIFSFKNSFTSFLSGF